jgi:TetR/AcrR family transcriptional repressor of mexJK operon
VARGVRVTVAGTADGGSEPVARRPRAGRPTREQAQRRDEELLDTALELFLDHGFERTTLDAVAAGAGTTKRTIRARHADKRALFVAAVQRAIDRRAIPPAALWAVTSDDLEDTLLAVARLCVSNAIAPAGRRLRRLADAESYRFPEIARQASDRGPRPTIAFIADLLRRHAERGTIRAAKPDLAATALVAMVADAAIRLPTPIAAHAIDESIRYCVALFLDGIRRV